jgi:hypothetical protein
MDETMAPWSLAEDYTYVEKGTKSVIIPGAGEDQL